MLNVRYVLMCVCCDALFVILLWFPKAPMYIIQKQEAAKRNAIEMHYSDGALNVCSVVFKDY